MVASHAPALGTWPATQACALTGNQTGDPLVRRLVLNPLSHPNQGRSLCLFTWPPPVCLSVFSPLLKRTPVIWFRAHPIQYGLILTNDICKDPLSKQGHALRFWVDVNLVGVGGALFSPLQHLKTSERGLKRQGSHMAGRKAIPSLARTGAFGLF